MQACCTCHTHTTEMMPSFRTVCTKWEVPEGETRIFVVDDVMIGIFHADGETLPWRIPAHMRVRHTQQFTRQLAWSTDAASSTAASSPTMSGWDLRPSLRHVLRVLNNLMEQR
jgi:hypothetical protein